MTAGIQVFIASSNERRDVVAAICHHLDAAKDLDLETHPWHKDTFELSASYIESLEAKLETDEFAVFVLTPDDLIQIRGKKHRVPRDNVLFEAGLFMGRLGRRYCYLVHEESQKRKLKSKLPSDLLGIKTATYRVGKGSLEDALQEACEQILAAIRKREDERRSSFCARLAGSWWERITTTSGYELSFFRAMPDAHFETIELVDGEHFNASGEPIGNWYSTVVGLRERDRAILYGWEGSHPPGWQTAGMAAPQEAKPDVEGFGEFRFQDADGVFVRGLGHFIDVVPGETSSAQSKSVELKRVESLDDEQKMLGGSTSAKQARAQEILGKW